VAVSFPQQQKYGGADSQVDDEACVEPIEIVVYGTGQPRLNREIDEITQQDSQEHSHPVVDHASRCIMHGYV
jgi:hypothetical protein